MFEVLVNYEPNYISELEVLDITIRVDGLEITLNQEQSQRLINILKGDEGEIRMYENLGSNYDPPHKVMRFSCEKKFSAATDPYGDPNDLGSIVYKKYWRRSFMLKDF